MLSISHDDNHDYASSASRIGSNRRLETYIKKIRTMMKKMIMMSTMMMMLMIMNQHDNHHYASSVSPAVMIMLTHVLHLKSDDTCRQGVGGHGH